MRGNGRRETSRNHRGTFRQRSGGLTPRSVTRRGAFVDGRDRPTHTSAQSSGHRRVGRPLGGPPGPREHFGRARMQKRRWSAAALVTAAVLIVGACGGTGGTGGGSGG